MMSPEDRPKSARQRVLDLVRGAEIRTLFTYEQLSRAAGTDVRKARTIVYGASRDLFKERGFGLVCVKGVGYQVMHPDEAPSLMRGRVRRAGQQIKAGRFVGEHVDTDLMSGEAKKHFESVDHEINVLGKELKQAQRRLDFHARTLASHSERLTKLEKRDKQLTEDELLDVREMIEKKRKTPIGC